MYSVEDKSLDSMCADFEKRTFSYETIFLKRLILKELVN